MPNIAMPQYSRAAGAAEEHGAKQDGGRCRERVRGRYAGDAHDHRVEESKDPGTQAVLRRVERRDFQGFGHGYRTPLWYHLQSIVEVPQCNTSRTGPSTDGTSNASECTPLPRPRATKGVGPAR